MRTGRAAIEFKARKLGYVPYATGTIDGHEVELISYPFEEGGRLYIMARMTPGDCTTMEQCQIPEGATDFVADER